MTILVRAPYDPTFVERLKLRVPAYARAWDASSKLWAVNRLYQPHVLDLCYEHFCQVIVNGQATPAPTNHQASDDYATLYLLPNAPASVVDAAYRALAKLHHPDVSPDPQATARMQQINVAYERIQIKEGR